MTKEKKAEPAKTGKKQGRPTVFSEELANEICALIVEGKSLRTIEDTDGMPGTTTIFRWLGDNEKFREQYAHAKAQQMTAMGEEILEIADQYSPEADVLQPDHIQRARLRIDTRKWLMSKCAPKVYGDRITHAGDAENPVVTKDLSSGESARRIAFHLRDAIREKSGADSADSDETPEVDAKSGTAD